MLAILKKEINSFFASPIGYLVVSLFLVVTGLFLWVFEGAFNIPNSGFADLAPFFQLAPWIFTFLIPAITMRSFSEEQKTGTLELLLTKPISTLQLVLGKYFGAVLLLIITIIPTLIYVTAIYQLGNPIGNLDVGVTVGSYVGLILLAASFSAMGIYASTLSDNQIVGFILSVLFCFVFYFGIDGIADYTSPLIANFGMQTHYDSISRGVIDTRDLIYFISIIAFFIYLTKSTLEKKR